MRLNSSIVSFQKGADCYTKIDSSQIGLLTVLKVTVDMQRVCVVSPDKQEWENKSKAGTGEIRLIVSRPAQFRPAQI